MLCQRGIDAYRRLVRVKIARERVVPLYIDREAARWLEAAESLLLLFREGIGMTRGEIDSEIDALFGGGGKATLVYRGLAKILEDRAEFEVVADVPPDVIRDKVFTAAADYRRQMRSSGAGPGHRELFRRDEILSTVAQELEYPARRRRDVALRRPARRESAAVVRRHEGPVADRPL